MRERDFDERMERQREKELYECGWMDGWMDCLGIFTRWPQLHTLRERERREGNGQQALRGSAEDYSDYPALFTHGVFPHLCKLEHVSVRACSLHSGCNAPSTDFCFFFAVRALEISLKHALLG